MKKIDLNNIGVVLGFLVAAHVFFLTFIPCVMAFEVDVNIPERYLDVNAGDRVGFEVDVRYPENSVKKDIEIYYEIKSGDNIVFDSSVIKSIEKSAFFIDFINLSKGLNTGTYTLNVTAVDFGDVFVYDTADFDVTGSRDEEIRTYLLVFFGIAVVFVFVFVILKDVAKKDVDTKKEE